MSSETADMYGQTTRIADARMKRPDEDIRHEQTRVVEIYMAGDLEHAKPVVRHFCHKYKVCVTLTPTTFFYNGGEESGFVVGFRNYPKFPTDSYTLRRTAQELADWLREELFQRSYMVVDCGGMTTWSSISEQ